MHRPEWTAELIPSGVPSETVSGLSEAAHPYPRPCVHERLARELAEAAPDMVIACYGMNDGIYHPFSEERFAAYQAGMLALSTRVGEAGAGIVLMTPPPFDALSMTGSYSPQTRRTSVIWRHTRTTIRCWSIMRTGCYPGAALRTK